MSDPLDAIYGMRLTFGQGIATAQFDHGIEFIGQRGADFIEKLRALLCVMSDSAKWIVVGFEDGHKTIRFEEIDLYAKRQAPT